MMGLYEYKILDKVYDDIISGNKKVEFRLLNEKSESIKNGDNILFKVINNEKKNVLVEVINKYVYDYLDDLQNHKEVLHNTIKYSKEEFINAFCDIFKKEKVDNSEIVGIEFEIISK